MPPGYQRNGRLELRFSDDHAQMLATIYPPSGNGNAITVREVLECMKARGVLYGVRESVIAESIVHATETAMPVVNVVVAQGTLPQDGKDARIRYTLPIETLSLPLPKRTDGSGLPDWFSLHPAKLVNAGDELARLTPAKPGIPGKTLTWPVQSIAPKPGKYAALNAGQNVRLSDSGLRLLAAQDGYVCLQGDTLTVYGLRQVMHNVIGQQHIFPTGAVFLAHLQQTQVQAGGTVAVQGKAFGCRFRAHEDIYLTYAEHCTIVATGNVYVTEGLIHCQINTRKKVIGLGAATICGGEICATEGVYIAVLGSPEATATDIRAGVDRFAEVRNQEIQEELAACEANIQRIGQALKPFATVAVNATLPDDKRHLLQKLQAQKRGQEARIKDLHSERRNVSLTSNDLLVGTVSVTHVAHPGVCIRIGQAATQLASPVQSVRFVESSEGPSVKVEPLARAA